MGLAPVGNDLPRTNLETVFVSWNGALYLRAANQLFRSPARSSSQQIPPFFDVQPREVQLADGASNTIFLTEVLGDKGAISGWEARIEQGSDWLRFTNLTDGSSNTVFLGDGSVRQVSVAVDANTTGNWRYGRIRYYVPGAVNSPIDCTIVQVDSGTAIGERAVDVSAQAIPPEGGQVILRPSGGAAGQVRTGTRVEAEAIASPGFEFRQWSDAASGTNPVATVLADGSVRFIGSFVQPATPTRDGYEPNDSFARAQPLTVDIPGVTELHGLVMEGPDDWYLLQLPALTHLRVTVVFDHSLGDVQLQMFDRRQAVGPDGFGAQMGASTGTTDSEEITYVNTSSPAELLVRVYHQHGGINPAYSMIIETIQTDDPLSAPGTLDSGSPCGTIPTLAVGSKTENLVLRQVDDWYRMDIPQGVSRLHVRADHNFFSGDVNLMIVADAEADCNAVFSRIIAGGFSTDASQNFEEVRDINVQGLSSVMIRVYGANFFMRNVYDLSISGE